MLSVRLQSRQIDQTDDQRRLAERVTIVGSKLEGRRSCQFFGGEESAV